jgi:hypothetical protein
VHWLATLGEPRHPHPEKKPKPSKRSGNSVRAIMLSVTAMEEVLCVENVR